jgi:hypothetical protein
LVFCDWDGASDANSRDVLFDRKYPALIDSQKLRMSYFPEELDQAHRCRLSDDFNWLAIGEKDGVRVGRLVQNASNTTHP